jgi:hypothetical protein
MATGNPSIPASQRSANPDKTMVSMFDDRHLSS